MLTKNTHIPTKIFAISPTAPDNRVWESSRRQEPPHQSGKTDTVALTTSATHLQDPASLPLSQHLHSTLQHVIPIIIVELQSESKTNRAWCRWDKQIFKNEAVNLEGFYAGFCRSDKPDYIHHRSWDRLQKHWYWGKNTILPSSILEWIYLFKIFKTWSLIKD